MFLLHFRREYAERNAPLSRLPFYDAGNVLDVGGSLRRGGLELAESRKPRQSLALELPDALARQVELVADRLERPGLAVEAEAKLEDAALALGQSVESAPHAWRRSDSSASSNGSAASRSANRSPELALVVVANREPGQRSFVEFEAAEIVRETGSCRGQPSHSPHSASSRT